MALGNLFARRRAAPVASNTNTVTGDPAIANTTGAGHVKEKRRHHGAHSDNLNSRPSFGQWFKSMWVDLLTMVILGVIGLGVYSAPPAPARSFPITFQDGQIVYPQFAYPLRKEIIPIWAAAMLAVLVPIVVFLICSIRVRSFWDINNATIGLLYSVISAAVFQVFCKWLIGGLRPHFLDVCQPNVSGPGVQTGNGYGSIMYTPEVCTGDRSKINDSLESFPSGHTTAAFGGFVYLSLYLNAKLKVFANYHPAMWKLIAVYAPVLGAVLIGGALTIDEFHNWYDVVAGAIIGTMFAFSSYRMLYASIWDFRFNHIPLVRHMPFTYSAASAGQFSGFHDAMWTRKAGWGTSQAFAANGAPFDASAFGTSNGHVGGGLDSSNGAPYRDSTAYNDGHESHNSHRMSTLGRKPVPAVGEDVV